MRDPRAASDPVEASAGRAGRLPAAPDRSSRASGARPSGAPEPRRLRTGLAAVLVAGAAGLVGRLPAPVATWVGRRLGDVLFLLVPRRRRLACRNLALAFPEAPAAHRRRLARRSCQHLGLVLVELCALIARRPEDFLARITLDGLEHLDRAMAGYGRVLVVSAHLGNWELLALAHRLTPYSLAIVVRPLDARWLGGLAEEARRRMGAELIDKRDGLPAIRAALQGGRMVGVLLDQNATRREGVFVDFFGRPASTSRALALLAVRTGVPVLPAFARRLPDGRHRISIEPPLLPDRRAPAARAVADLTARCTAAVEAAVRRTPEQWLWVHDRWRTRPPGS